MLNLGALLFTASCNAAPSNAVTQTFEEEAPVNSELVAVEFDGSSQTLDSLAVEAERLGWRIGVRTDSSLRILPPPDYDPDGHFGPLIERIEILGLADIGLRLVGPNGPVGPED
jgi:hypothetical protein